MKNTTTFVSVATLAFTILFSSTQSQARDYCSTSRGYCYTAQTQKACTCKPDARVAAIAKTIVTIQAQITSLQSATVVQSTTVTKYDDAKLVALQASQGRAITALETALAEESKQRKAADAALSKRADAVTTALSGKVSKETLSKFALFLEELENAKVKAIADLAAKVTSNDNAQAMKLSALTKRLAAVEAIVKAHELTLNPPKPATPVISTWSDLVAFFATYKVDLTKIHGDAEELYCLYEHGKVLGKPMVTAQQLTKWIPILKSGARVSIVRMDVSECDHLEICNGHALPGAFTCTKCDKTSHCGVTLMVLPKDEPMSLREFALQMASKNMTLTLPAVLSGKIEVKYIFSQLWFSCQ